MSPTVLSLTSTQVVDLYSGTLESRLAVSVVPGIRAVLVTQCKVLPAPPTTLSIVVERTRVERATTPLAPLLNSLALPVRALAELAGYVQWDATA